MRNPITMSGRFGIRHLTLCDKLNYLFNRGGSVWINYDFCNFLLHFIKPPRLKGIMWWNKRAIGWRNFMSSSTTRLDINLFVILSNSFIGKELILVFDSVIIKIKFDFIMGEVLVAIVDKHSSATYTLSGLPSKYSIINNSLSSPKEDTSSVMG